MTQLRPAAIGTVMWAIPIGVAAWAIGVNGIQSVFLASVVMTVGAGHTIIARRDPSQTDGWWTDRSASTPDGTRREVRELSWSLTGRRGTVTPAAGRRLRHLAEHRLARHGIDLHDSGHADAAERLLGSRAYRVVMADPDRPIRYPAFVHSVAAIEHLHDLPISTRIATPQPIATPDSIPEQRR